MQNTTRLTTSSFIACDGKLNGVWIVVDLDSMLDSHNISGGLSMSEIWLSISGYGDCYSVSNLGRVMRTSPRNIARHPTKSRAKPFVPSLCRSFINRGGYPQVRIGPTGFQKTVCVHRLVASAFIDNPLQLPEVNHIDGNKANNSTVNLEWVTHQTNLKHATRTGLQITRFGESSPNSKLSDADAAAIRTDTRSARLIAADYGVHANTVYIIRQRRGWNHLP